MNAPGAARRETAFKVKSGTLDEVRALLEKFIASTSAEDANLDYDYTGNEDVLFCREAYVGADGLLKPLDNVGNQLQELPECADVAWKSTVHPRNWTS